MKQYNIVTFEDLVSALKEIYGGDDSGLYLFSDDYLELNDLKERYPEFVESLNLNPQKEVEDYYLNYTRTINRLFTESNLPTFEAIEERGGEGQGTEWWIVYKFSNGMYLKIEGSYYSYDGVHLYGWEDSVTQVKPTSELVTVYRKIEDTANESYSDGL